VLLSSRAFILDVVAQTAYKAAIPTALCPRHRLFALATQPQHDPRALGHPTRPGCPPPFLDDALPTIACVTDWIFLFFGLVNSCCTVYHCTIAIDPRIG
jgi:hypothetical protein